MQQQYLNALSKLSAGAKRFNDEHIPVMLDKLLELSMQPAEQLAHWNKIRRYMFTVADAITIQEIDQYLTEKVKQ